MAGDEVDAVIVGSGAAGSAMAAKLAAGGKRVVILEAGPARSNADLVSSGLWARRLKWGGAPVVESGENPVGHVFNAGWGVGGSAMHHFAVWPRLHADDFDMRSRHDTGLDWPIGYDDLRPWYDRVQAEVGISGDHEKERWRPPGDPYPMGPVASYAQGELIAAGFAKEGFATAPLPLAVTSAVYDGRPACLWDGWCDAGCPIGALANPLTVHLPKAQAAGAVLHAGCPVTKILTNAEGDRATGVEYVDAAGERQQLMAAVVVVAAFAVQTPRLLLASRNDRHPDGLANSSGLVGKYVMSHPAAIVHGLFDAETECHMGATGGQFVCQDGYAKDTHASAGAFGSYQWMIAQATKPTDLLGIATTRPDIVGADLDPFMRRAVKHFGTMTAVIEDLPVADNAVTLSDRVDANGVPLAEVSHTTHPQSKALWAAVLDEGKSVFAAAGATEVWTGPQAAMHIVGGTIMGDDPQTSVTNSYGQCHDIGNLVIAGPGLFPTSAGVNPTYTLHAVTARSADHLLSGWGALT